MYLKSLRSTKPTLFGKDLSLYFNIFSGNYTVLSIKKLIENYFKFTNN